MRIDWEQSLAGKDSGTSIAGESGSTSGDTTKVHPKENEAYQREDEAAMADKESQGLHKGKRESL